MKSLQYLHNAEVKAYVLDTIKYLSGEKPDATEALNSANKALAAIQKRQKLIKLADKSEAARGWL